MPAEYTTWVEGAFGWARVNWVSLIYPSACSPFSNASGFRSWLLIKGLVPLVVIGVAVIRSTVVNVTQLGWSSKNLKIGALQALPLALLLSFSFCPSVSMSIFQSWLCKEYEFDGRDAQSVTTHKFLLEDLSIRCSDSSFKGAEHDTITSMAFIFIFIWPVGMVVLFGATLLPCRSKLHANIRTPLVDATKFLHRDYRVDCFYWELVELVRRTILVGWVLLIPTDKTFLRLVVALLLSVTSLAVLLSASPYKRPEDNVLAAGCQLTLSFSLIGVTYIRIYNEIQLATSGAVVQRIMSFSSTSVIALPVLVITFSSIALMITIMVSIIRKEGFQASIRLSKTGQPPELTLKKGHKWHLFLSHIWSTGQDANATIKRQLQRVLLSSSIFLDVDDLKNIGDLELYIDQSSSINIFLSHGYFKSKNCLREVQATMDKKKPFMCTHEVDKDKGGGPLKEIQIELEDEQLISAIFTEERLITIWHRVTDFQLLSLKEIAEFTLLQTPAYQKRVALPLFVPGELLREPLGFNSPLVLYTSPLNPGASEVAAELEKAYFGLTATTELPTSLLDGDVEATKRHACCSISPKRPTKAPIGTSGGAQATHFLLYLNFDSFLGDVGKQLAEELRCARAAQFPIVMAHENGEPCRYSDPNSNLRNAARQ